MKNTTTNVKFSEIKENLCKIVLIASFVVYHSKFEETWLSSKYVMLSV